MKNKKVLLRDRKWHILSIACAVQGWEEGERRGYPCPGPAWGRGYPSEVPEQGTPSSKQDQDRGIPFLPAPSPQARPWQGYPLPPGKDLGSETRVPPPSLPHKGPGTRGHRVTPPPCFGGQTENITLPRTSYAGGNKTEPHRNVHAEL